MHDDLVQRSIAKSSRASLPSVKRHKSEQFSLQRIAFIITSFKIRVSAKGKILLMIQLAEDIREMPRVSGTLFRCPCIQAREVLVGRGTGRS